LLHIPSGGVRHWHNHRQQLAASNHSDDNNNSNDQNLSLSVSIRMAIAGLSGLRSARFLISLQASSRLFRRPLCSERGSDSDKVPGSLRQKFQTFDEQKPAVIRDFHEETYGIEWEEKHREVDDESFYLYRDKKKPEVRAQSLPTTRGVHGVFDIADLVEALRSEKLTEISVVRVPEHAHYCDYLVLATTKSVRHMQAVIQFIRKLYKLKKNPDDPHLSLTIGEKIKSPWQVIDMGYIVLHLFQPNIRESYDLESLWCVGPEFDEMTARPQYSHVIDFMERHIKFIEQLQPVKNNNVPDSASSPA
jgi:ribosome silencing factor RsfS/YbeB/iojap